MTTADAIEKTIDAFPFPGYMKAPNGHIKGAYANIADAVQKYVPRGGKILDVGCGPCDKTAILQYLGYECYGYDDLQDVWHRQPGNREKILEFTRNVGVNFIEAQGTGPLPFEKEFFDLAMMHDVLEHLHDSPRELLNDMLEVVKPEGYLFLTVPNAANIRKRLRVLIGKTNLPPFREYYWSQGPWRGHVREYVRDDLAQLAQFLKCDIVELRSCDHMLQRVRPVVLPFYLAVTSVFRGWKDGWALIVRKPPGWNSNREVSQQDLDRFIKGAMQH